MRSGVRCAEQLFVRHAGCRDLPVLVPVGFFCSWGNYYLRLFLISVLGGGMKQTASSQTLFGTKVSRIRIEPPALHHATITDLATSRLALISSNAKENQRMLQRLGDRTKVSSRLQSIKDFKEFYLDLLARYRFACFLHRFIISL